MILYNKDQLHSAVCQYLAGCTLYSNEAAAFKPLMKDLNNNRVPKNNGPLLMIKNISIGAIIIFSYAIENLIKAFSPQIKRRHLQIKDIPGDLSLDFRQEFMLIQTILPLLKDGYLRYHEPKRKTNNIDSKAAKDIFIQIFHYYINKNSIDPKEIKCFKVEFLEYDYPYIKELINSTG